MTFWVAAGTDQTSGWCYVSREADFYNKNLCYQWTKTISNSCKQFVHQQDTVKKTPTSSWGETRLPLTKEPWWQQGMHWRTETGNKSSHPQCEYCDDDEKQRREPPPAPWWQQLPGQYKMWLGTTEMAALAGNCLKFFVLASQLFIIHPNHPPAHSFFWPALLNSRQ